MMKASTILAVRDGSLPNLIRIRARRAAGSDGATDIPLQLVGALLSFPEAIRKMSLFPPGRLDRSIVVCSGQT